MLEKGQGYTIERIIEVAENTAVVFVTSFSSEKSITFTFENKKPDNE